MNRNHLQFRCADSLAREFKALCAKRGVSMTDELVGFMEKSVADAELEAATPKAPEETSREISYHAQNGLK